MITQHIFRLPDIEDTELLARRIAKVIVLQSLSYDGVLQVPNFVITLNGNLGAGKTTLIRSILRAIGITGTVKSPTFTLLESYELSFGDSVTNINSTYQTKATIELNHFDLYRFADPEEWFMAGFDEYFKPNSVCFIEWANKAQGIIPQIDWNLELQFNQLSGIVCNLQAISPLGMKYLNQLLSIVETVK